MTQQITRYQRGFTLIELLVVISIISVLSGLILVNVVGVRERAADARRKNDLRQLKSALRLYYNDYNNYPAGTGTLDGCGANGTGVCSSGGVFSAGTGPTIYMNDLPQDFEYYSDGGEGFILVTPLDNDSDVDATASQTRCDPAGRPPGYGYTTNPIPTNDYFVCED